MYRYAKMSIAGILFFLSGAYAYGNELVQQNGQRPHQMLGLPEAVFVPGTNVPIAKGYPGFELPKRLSAPGQKTPALPDLRQPSDQRLIDPSCVLPDAEKQKWYKGRCLKNK
jgi:hypothetical protein